MVELRSVEVVGGGPAGLYAAMLIKRAMPAARIRVTEQNPDGATFGFGVVFSDQALDFLRADDPTTHDLIAPLMERWRNMTLVHRGRTVTIDGIGFAAIGRLELIGLLQRTARAAGVEIRHATQLTTLDGIDADLVIGADGLNSLVRRSAEATFAPRLEHFSNRFAWFGAPVSFDTLTQTFVEIGRGALNAHHYRYAPGLSTFIVECDAATFEAHGFGDMDEAASAEACAAIFADALGGAKLLTNRSNWRRFPRLWCENWVSGNRVLVGDAAHTAHFSVGSGTRLAMEDAVALAGALREERDLASALAAYQDRRRPIARKIVDAANSSAGWYERFPEKMRLAPLDFGFDYITRSGRVDLDRLRRSSPQFMAAWAARERVDDPVGETPGSTEIGFDKADHPNCSSILYDNMAQNADRTAVVGLLGMLTYRELCAEASRWGNAFASFGLARGERIAFFLDDTPTYPAAFFGAVRAGFVPVLLNTQTTPDLLRFYLQDCGARLALCEAEFAGLFSDEVRRGTALERVVVANGDAPGGMSGAADFVAGQPADLVCADTGPDDMAFWMYSSGSTGRPKGIVHLHHDMAYTQAAYARNFLDLSPDDVCFSVPKVFFAYGFGNAFTFPFSVGAASLLMPGRPEPSRILDMIERFRPTVFFGLPTLYTALCRAEGAAARDLSSLRLSISAAETLSEDVFNAWKTLTGLSPVEGLGSTEMLHIYLSNRPGDERPGSAGRRVPGYEVELRDPDGRVVADGEDGVMFVRGHSSAPCYWNGPDKTEETMRGDWIHTGDRFVCRDGHYYFQGRADDLVKISGQWVWPLEVERCLAEHPYVHECAVIAHPLPDRRMTLRAFVALRPGHRSGDVETRLLQDHVRERLMPYKYPRLVDYLPEMPKTGTGKIDRQALMRLAMGGE
jgi:benzoate-CoA ligase family protein